ncbi:MAG: diacylglycerol kinase family lipid kinase, partial [Muribaculaceae bacterium]|nr:diacylglycerol kinase family lipid kinase [Muribaculaceae bacterium]
CTVNDKPFLCTCGVGFDAKVAYEFANAGKRGFFTYIKKTLSEYIHFKPDTYEVTVDGKKVESPAFVVSCCNAAQYGNNAFIAPHATMLDGQIDVTLIRPFRFYSVPVLGLRLFTKTLDRNRHVSTMRGSNIVITRSSDAPMHIDGDPMQMPSRLEVKCHPKGIKVFWPGKDENRKK